jgi:flavin reductase (DIM6/NTAB) family NADH-FMN oxidoreductase RutF
LWVITARDAGRASGLVATSVSQASISEWHPRLTVGLARQHLTGQLVERSGSFVAHLLHASQHDWVRHFGTQSGRETDKFSGWKTQAGITGAPILSETGAWVECRVETSLDAGDRLWYLAEIVDAKWTTDFIPYTLQQFLARADDDLKALLKQQLEADSLTDEGLIADWKLRRSR